MELDQLYAFREIADTKNLTKAAGNLHISQSALSTKIKTLESELGTPLFERSSRGMELTANGERLLKKAQETLHSAETLKKEAFILNGESNITLTIGLNTTPHCLHLAEINAYLNIKHPNLNVIFMASETKKTEEMLKKGNIDLGFYFAYDMPDEIESIKVADVPVCVVVPKSFSEDAASLGYEEIASMQWVWTFEGCPFYTELRAEFAERGLAPKKVIKTEDEYIVRELVVKGLGAALLQESMADELVA